jgi:two-component sensor histidine kinase
VTALSDLHWALFKIDSIQGNYLSSIDHLRKHRIFLDSIFNEVQRKKLNELRVQYETSRKDQDIKYLKQQGELKEARLQQAGLTRNITLAGVFLLLVILGLLYGQYRGKQRTNEQLQGKQQEISRKNEALEQLVEDKEWLVKEIHHRVKNNLHTIVSLLESQSAFLGNDALAAVRDSQHRVYAMSLIHQKLYLSEDVTTVNMDIYVKELVSYLQESFDISQKVRFMVETNDINLDAGTAIPLGLVLNEAITNSIKYAFPERTGFVTVKLDKTGEDFELAITDNGVGLPHDFDITKSKTLGMRLIKGLTKELGGTFSIGSYSSGTTVSVIFRERVLRRLREIQHVQAEV